MLLYYKPPNQRPKGSVLPSVQRAGKAQRRSLEGRSSLDLLPFNALITFLLIIIYIFYRIRVLLAVQCPAKWVSWLYVIAEVGLFIPGLLMSATRILALGGQAHIPRTHDQQMAKSPPRIDVFIPCCGEAPDVVATSIEGALASEYPTDKLRVIVLDDGRSKDLADLVSNMRTTRTNLFYHSREKTKNHHYKAGNLNDGIEWVKTLPGPPAPFIAVLDADMIPEPHWLQVLLPQVLSDPKIALACPPQDFYDVPMEDPLTQALEVQYRVTNPLKGAAGAAYCGGSGFVLRRKALEEVGGFPTVSLTEDNCLSNFLFTKGWQGVYVDEALQYGRVPESFAAHVVQQTRWKIGDIQTALAMRCYFWGGHCGIMALCQRLNGLLYMLLALSNITTTIGLLALVTSMVASGPLVAYSTRSEMMHLLRLICAITLNTWLGDIIAAQTIGYAVAVREGSVTLWIAPYIATGIIRAFILPTWLGGSSVGFTSSGSQADDIKERDAAHRAPFWPKRARHFFLDCHIWMHLAFFLLMLFGLGRRIWEVCSLLSQEPSLSPSYILQAPEFMDKLVVHVGWPPVLAYGATMSALVPILYACWPPSVPSYSKLLQRDTVRQASYPTQRVKQSVEDPDYKGTVPFPEAKHTASMLYVAYLLAWSMM